MNDQPIEGRMFKALIYGDSFSERFSLQTTLAPFRVPQRVWPGRRPPIQCSATHHAKEVSNQSWVVSRDAVYEIDNLLGPPILPAMQLLY